MIVIYFYFFLWNVCWAQQPSFLDMFVGNDQDHGDLLMSLDEDSSSLDIDSKKISQKSLASGTIPGNLPREVLYEVAQEILEKARASSVDVAVSHLSSLMQRRKKCNQTVPIMVISSSDPCKPVQESLFKTFFRKCTTETVCEAVWTAVLRMIPSEHNETESANLTEKVKRFRQDSKGCKGNKTCFGVLNLSPKKLQKQQKQVNQLIGSVPRLWKEMKALLRQLEECPGAGFRTCRDARDDLRSTRVQLEVSYRPVLEFLNMSLENKICKDNQVCVDFVKSKLESFKNDSDHNQRSLETMPTFMIDPAFGGPVVAFFAVMLVLCCLTLGAGAYWKVLWIFQKYVTAVVVLGLTCCLAISVFSIGMIGIPNGMRNVYEILEAFSTRVGLYSLLSATILFCSALVGGMLSEVFGHKHASKVVRVSGLVAIAAFGVIVLVMLVLRAVAITNANAAFVYFFDLNGVDDSDFTDILLATALCLATLIMVVFAVLLLIRSQNDQTLTVKTGWFLALSSMMLFGSLIKCGVIFYEKFGEYYVRAWVRSLIYLLLADLLIMPPLLIMIAGMFYSRRRALQSLRQEKQVDEQPLLHTDELEERESLSDSIPYQYDV